MNLVSCLSTSELITNFSRISTRECTGMKVRGKLREKKIWRAGADSSGQLDRCWTGKNVWIEMINR
jgi:hypothetical protein